MKIGTVIKSVKLNEQSTIVLDKIYPIMPFDPLKYNVMYFIDDEEQTVFLGSYYANKLIVKSSTEDELIIKLGAGYISEIASDWRKLFVQDSLWQGGDGIFSFNIANGNDQFDQRKFNETLMVFGDTFVGRYDPKTQKRLQPHLMPNNSIATLKSNKNIDFKLNRGDFGEIKAFYEMREDLNFKGPIPRNLVTYDSIEADDGYLSGYNPNMIELVFDLHKSRYITSIDFYNYYNEESKNLSKRGFKDITIYGSNDNENFDAIIDTSLEMALSNNYKQSVKIRREYRYFKIVCHNINGVGNHNDKTYQEGLFGLNRVKFFNENRQFKDVDIEANTFMQRESLNAWIWLQDGVVVKEHLYFLPLVVCQDLTQPEGLQFRVLGVSLFKTPIIDGKIETGMTEQKMSPLYAYDGAATFMYGAGIMANTIQSGAKNPDGYIYVYGYKTTMGLRELIVARVMENEFEHFDEWSYYDGNDWSNNILDSEALLGHISCEMSVSEILEGKYAGKYLAAFTYDVNTEYVSIALGDSPSGPFTKPQKVYKTLEKNIYKSTTYTYNAKAHPHLSNSKKILISYNTNTYDFDHNMSHRLIYGPRFIYLNEIEE